MSKGASGNALKDQNRLPLWLTIAVNLAVLYAFTRIEAVSAGGVPGLLSGATGFLPMGLALTVTSVANGFLSADAKARLVFLRRAHALPGHRAFSIHGASDPRVDIDALRRHLGKEWPMDPVAENRVWYRFYKEFENDPAILQMHREFLFTRDYATFAALFIPILGTAAAITVRPVSMMATYLGLLVLQFVLVRRAAATYGERLVCTVLARKAASVAGKPKAGRARPSKAQP